MSEPPDPRRRVSGELETRMVFVDTSVFVSQNFAFGGQRFTSLKELCRRGKLSLLLTDVTVREVEARILARVGKAARALKDIKQDVNILKPLRITGLEAVFTNLDKAVQSEALNKRFHEYLGETGCEIISVDVVQANSVFELYFAGKPPFGEGKKKDEFPDAFVLAALGSWCECNDEKIYVVSEDSDMSKACEESSLLIHEAKLSTLLELALEDEGLATREAHERFSIIRDEVIEQVRQAFEEGLYMNLLDEDGEALRVRVKDVRLGEELVISLSEVGAEYALDAEVSFEADITYPDPNSVFRDSDTGDYLYLGSLEETVERTLEVPVEVSLTFDPYNLGTDSVTRVIVNNDESFWINVAEDEVH